MKKRETFLGDHQCELFFEPDIIERMVPGSGACPRSRRACLRYITVSDKDVRARRLFKSAAGISYERKHHMRTSRSIIHPMSNFRRHWNFFMILVYMYAFWVIPANMGFNDPKMDGAEAVASTWAYVDLVHCTLCLTDMLINFNTGYVLENSKNVILSRSKIIAHYWRTWFLVDFISSIPVDHILFFTMNMRYPEWPYFFCYFRLIKISRMYTMNLYLIHFGVTVGIPDFGMELIHLILTAYQVLHVCGCVGYFVAWISEENGIHESWMVRRNMRNEPFWAKYQLSLFRVTAHIMTVGYGTASPRNIPDEMYCSLLGLLGVILNCLIIGRFMQWATIQNGASSKYEEMLQQLKTYMLHKHLPHSLQKRIIDYYEFRFQKSYFKEAEIINSLSTHLRQEIVLHSCRQLVDSVSFFEGLPLALLLRIVAALRSEIFLVNDVIVKVGTEGHSLYFIKSGTVAIYSATGKEECHLEDGAHFGEVALVTPERRRVASVVAVEICELYRLDRNDFERAISPYPDLVARIERIAQERLEQIHEADKKYRRSARERKKLAASAAAAAAPGGSGKQGRSRK